MARTALVTGAAGFIGSHLVDRLLREGWEVTALDNFDNFYAPSLKRLNVAEHLGHPAYRLVEVDLRDRVELMARLTGPYDVILHLAAKAGTRPSIADPHLYDEVNVQGTVNLLDLAQRRGVPQVVFASSSSVYGVNPRVPWREEDNVLLPINPYASTKVSGELLGHVYSHLHGIRFIALRLFTVYGPRQRPDLAIRKFAQCMLRDEPVPLFGEGATRRDYTYVDDVVDGFMRAIEYKASPYEVINIGNFRPVSLSELVAMLEEILGVRARVARLPAQAGDVPQTWASIDKARRLLGYEPRTPLREGLEHFVGWLGEALAGASRTQASTLLGGAPARQILAVG